MKRDVSASGKSTRMIWIVLSFVPFLNWFPMLIAGMNARYAKWWISGVLYFLPVLLIFTLVTPDAGSPARIIREDGPLENLIILAFIITYIASIYHIFSIRKAYKARVRRQEQNRQEPAKNRQKDPLLREAVNLSESILAKIKRSRNFESSMLKEIRPLVETYMQQLKQLSEKDAQLEEVLRNNKPVDLIKKRSNMVKKLEMTDDPELKTEYQKAIDQLDEQQQMLEDFRAQQEKIRLRMQNNLASLRQLKYNLLKLEHLNTNQQRSEVFQAFDEKVNELSDYLEALDSTYFKNQNR